jgi:acyl carrier protein
MSDVADRCRKVIAQLLKVAPERVTPGANFVRDLGMESVRFVELLAALEEEFDVEIDEDRAGSNDTVGKAVAYIEELVAK